MANRSLFVKFEVHSSLRSDAIVITTTDGRTDRHSANVLEFRANQETQDLRSIFLGVTYVLTKVIYPLWGRYKNNYWLRNEAPDFIISSSVLLNVGHSYFLGGDWKIANLNNCLYCNISCFGNREKVKVEHVYKLVNSVCSSSNVLNFAQNFVHMTPFK